jgi:phosphatidylinositol 4-kinase
LQEIEYHKLKTLYTNLKSLSVEHLSQILEREKLKAAYPGSFDGERVELSDVQQLLLLLLESELNRFSSWLEPVGGSNMKDNGISDLSIPFQQIKWQHIVKTATSIDPVLAFHLRDRFMNCQNLIDPALVENFKNSEVFLMSSPQSISFLLKSSWKNRWTDSLRLLTYWKPVSPIVAIQLLNEKEQVVPHVLQYAIRSLEYFPIETVFFYIPQLVQLLRNDPYGYREKFIIDAAKTSPRFAHQIIWNMNANMFKDETCVEMDPLKPTLERLIEKIVSSLTGSDKKFYEKEFRFFEQVTGISGKLKPLVEAGASKFEKKKKIDEEIRKIKVEVGVYLPTNPDQIVVDIDYDSGKPLQSHAKAPFMATFKVKDARQNSLTSEWMSCIFKVGDDCRQDVLALQLISVFQKLFTHSSLDLYTFPYRVVATAPGVLLFYSVWCY